MRERGETTNYFLLNLGIADLFVTIVIPFSIHSAYKECWDLSMSICKFNSFLVTLSLLTAIHTLMYMYISIHKFVSVRRVAVKNNFNDPVSRRTSFILIGLAWIYALIFSILTVMSEPIFKEKTLQCGPRYPVIGNKIFFLHIANQIGNLFIPLVILTFCYIRIFMHIRHHTHEQRRMSSCSGEASNTQGERGVTLVILACFLLSRLSYIVYTTYGAIVKDEKNDIPLYLNPFGSLFLGNVTLLEVDCAPHRGDPTLVTLFHLLTKYRILQVQ
uniref:G-protein coupled receptors family 1 profile domain-containing protein n=1 Tax=Magallana gigas TaxID=29159 RepID=A0A8W8M2Y1_MAGGI